MLQIKNLTVTHLKDLKIIIKDFSLILNEGDKAAIIGEEGNGKSTLLQLIYDEKLVEDYVEFSGEIIKNNSIIGYLAQELTYEQKCKTIYEFCIETPCFSNVTPKELSRIAKQLGINAELFYSDQKIQQLSGGEKVKLQFAKILMEQPDILLLDEPSNDIDIETLIWLEKFINDCKTPILYVSHDETLLENTANMIVHLEQVKRKTVPLYTVIRMGYEEYVRTRLSSLEHQDQMARNERKEYTKQQEKFRQIQQKVEYQQNIITRQDPAGGRLLKKKMHAVKSMEKRFEKEYESFTEFTDTEDTIFIKFGKKVELPNSKKVIEFYKDRLTIGTRLLSKDIRLTLIGPEKICIVGKNGVGKTTLIKEIAQELLKRNDIKAAYMPQNYEELLDFELTPVEFLTQEGDKEEDIRLCTYLGSMKYTADEMNHKIHELSGGQKAKLLFLKMSIDGCNVLILDEPTRNLSPLSNPAIRKVLQCYPGAIISISHDRKYIEEVCTKVYSLNENGLQIEDQSTFI